MNRHRSRPEPADGVSQALASLRRDIFTATDQLETRFAAERKRVRRRKLIAGLLLWLGLALIAAVFLLRKWIP